VQPVVKSLTIALGVIGFVQSSDVAPRHAVIGQSGVPPVPPPAAPPVPDMLLLLLQPTTSAAATPPTIASTGKHRNTAFVIARYLSFATNEVDTR
jgi:hypothetical protein